MINKTNMKILSFDIGIKNLAYCCLNDENKILHWNIINLISDDEEKRQCSFINKKSTKQCKKNANFMSAHLEQKQYLCQFHHKKLDNLEQNNYKSLIFKNNKCDGQLKKKSCARKAKFYTKNLNYQDTTHVNFLCGSCLKKPQYDSSDFLQIQATGKTKGDQDFYECLFHHLEKHFCELWKDVNNVVLENQPSFKNPRMKSVQMFIFSYFFMKAKNAGAPIKIDFFNAGKKLDIYTGDEIDVSKKTKYAKTKYLGVEYAKYFLKKNTQDDFNETYLAQFKKKDDLADAYLQGMQYIWSIKNKK
jgi:hypothetical protein